MIESDLREIRQARGPVQDREVTGYRHGSRPKPTRALAAFAANLDPATLPAEVRQKLGWLLLDHLRVCSIGARLPWSDWARDYVGVVGEARAPRTCCSRPSTLNPQHATFLNVTFGSSFDADDTHVGAMLHPGVAVWSAALAIGRARRRIRARRAGRGRCGLRDDHPDRARRCSPAISSAASRAPAPATCSAPPRPPAGCCSAARSRAAHPRRASGSPAATPAASRSSTTRAPPASASRPRMRRRAASPRRC